MDILNKLVNDIFLAKESYTTNDYLIMMDILKYHYHKINGTLNHYNDDNVKVEIDLCEMCEEYPIHEDCLCSYCYYDRATSDEDSDAECYTGSYINPY